MIRIGKITIDDIEKAVDLMAEEEANAHVAVDALYRLVTEDAAIALNLLGQGILDSDRPDLIASAVLSTIALATKYSEERARKQAAMLWLAVSLVTLLLSYFLLYLPSIPQ